MKYILIITLLILNYSCKNNQKLDKPNIIYILADDLGYGDLSIYNKNSKIFTPNIDSIGDEGMVFYDMHSTSSVCTPTRYSILTGEYAWRTRLKYGVLWSYGEPLINENKNTVASMLKKYGYTTSVIGKWHLGLGWVTKNDISEINSDIRDSGLIRDINEDLIDFSKNPTFGPPQNGFDYSFILPSSLDIPPYLYLENNKFLNPVNKYTDGNKPNIDASGAFWRPGPMAEDFDINQVLPIFFDKSKKYIEKTQKEDKPFFLYLPLPGPHTPWLPDSSFKDSSEAGEYGDFVKMIDFYVGNLLDHLKSLNLEKNTMVIFTSDNGPYWWPESILKFNHKAALDLKGMKGDIYDGGHRIPFMVKYPGVVKEKSTNSDVNSLASLMSTLGEMLGEDHNNIGIDSYSFYEALINVNHKSELNPIIHHSSKGFFSLRKGKWKLIENLGSGGFSKPVYIEAEKEENIYSLFNMEDDISETNNLANKYPEIVKDLIFEMNSIKNKSFR
jgi:arylsulfatase A-like enzyme|tara:strand:+ start:7709 stop:9208 length:1500 start_codon:yes stop_codon:yes gene_type:complete